MAQKIIIDTDIGDDIDDALAIALALGSPELDLIGVTTVYGRVDLRTRLALKELQVFGRTDIPVATGIGKPLNRPEDTHVPSQTEIVKQEEKLQPQAKQGAVDFIISAARADPKNVILAPIGALTNVAAAVSADPRLKDNLKSIVMMGGVAGEKIAEYNIACDPEAPGIVFRSGIPVTMIGLDVTMKCRMKKEEVEKIEKSKSPGAKLLAQLIHIWQGGNSENFPVLHDPLAIAVIFDPSLVKTEKMAIEVDTGSSPERGFTKPVSGRPNADVALEVNRDRFVKMFVERIVGA